MTADGKWHPAANPPVSSSLLGPPRDAQAGVPSVRLRRAPRQADGASGHHRRGQGRRQVGHRQSVVSLR